MSNSTLADGDNSFSIFFNPASLAEINHREIGIYYSPSPFGMKELANAYVVYHEPFNFLSATIGMKTYGFKLYKENEITVGLAKNFDDKYFAGISISITNISIKNYGETNLLSTSVGNNIEITSDIFFGACVRNVYLASYSKYLKKPLQIETGFAYKSDEFVITSSMLKEEYLNPSYAFGAEIKLVRYLDLRVGFRNYPSSFSFGAGINYSFFEIDYSAFDNPNLGFTHQLGLLIHFNKDL
ncbi:MAG: hypothetical protein Fur0015_00990 [Ignavibacteriales bacterium]